MAVEFVGYAARASAHDKTGKIMPFVAQNTMILLAPVLFAASIYIVLGRIIRGTHGEAYSIIKPKRLTKLFVLGDVLSLVIQGGGAGLMVTGEHAKMAQAIIIVGLVFQIAIFNIFCTTAFLFHRRVRRSPLAESIPPETNWQQALYMLYAVSTLIMVRSVFRVIEFIMGVDGYLLSNEWPLYTFDAVPMFLVMAIWWQRFPFTLCATAAWVSVPPLGHSVPLSNSQIHHRW